MEYTTLDGEIHLTPALNWAEIQKLRAALAAKVLAGGNKWDKQLVEGPDWDPKSYFGFGPTVEETSRETDDGILQVRSASVLEFREESGSLARSVYTDEVVRIVRATFPNHIMQGELLLIGEDYQDIHKIIAADGEITVVKGKVVVNWADGSAATTLSR